MPFDLLPSAFVQDQLSARLDLAPPIAQTLARLADGRLGVAVQWHQIGLLDCLDGVCTCLDKLDADDPEGFGRELVETATALARRTAQPTEPDDAPLTDDDGENGTSGSNAKTVPTDELRDALKLVFMLLASLYRDALVTAHAPDADRCLPQLDKRVDKLARSWSADTLEAGVHAVANASACWIATSLRSSSANVSPPPSQAPPRLNDAADSPPSQGGAGGGSKPTLTRTSPLGEPRPATRQAQTDYRHGQ